jgi:hypothetical protein
MSSEPTPEQQQAIQEITKGIAQQLVAGKSQPSLVKDLVKKGFSEEAATAMVGRVAMALDDYKKSPAGRAVLAQKNKNRMLRGLAWTVVGTIITVVTYSSASVSGGTYYVCWGAILFGVIDFFAGLIGWLGNR